MNRGSGRLDNDRAGAGGGIARGVSGDVVDGVGGNLRGVDDDVAYERAIQECFVAEIMALVVGRNLSRRFMGCEVCKLRCPTLP